MMDATQAWQLLLSEVLSSGSYVSPRGKNTVEVLHRTTVVDMSRPVVTTPGRGLSYRFMAAEAYWILSGDDTVAGIAPYNGHIAQFSDDGATFFGAYGPKVVDQLPYVVDKLIEDPNSRQAGLTIWREKPPATRDVPCTVALFFSLRNFTLNCHAFMRSSDCWLGAPYDIFNFSMVAYLVSAHLNKRLGRVIVTPGRLYLTAASAHLYEHNWADARSCQTQLTAVQPPVPYALVTDPSVLMGYLHELRETKPGDSLRWWEVS